MFDGDAGLRIGTSSWSERDWLGVFYPRGTAPREFIRHYSTVYDTVEIDATFYAMPSDTHIRAWRERSSDGFLFAAKTPRMITHEKVLAGDAIDDMRVFIDTMRGLGERLGPLLLQFPYFNKRAFSGPEPFFERLDGFLEKLPEDVRVAVEVRNARWVGPELQRIGARHGVAIAWVEQAWMPRAGRWPALLGGPSTDFAYIRWLGDHKAIEKVTDRWDRLVLDRSEAMEAWIPVMRELRARGVEVFGFFNNHFAGHAPASIELFRELWRAAQAGSP